jgi:hypothetical protein
MQRIGQLTCARAIKKDGDMTVPICPFCGVIGPVSDDLVICCKPICNEKIILFFASFAGRMYLSYYQTNAGLRS